MTMPSAPVRPIKGYFTLAREIMDSLECPELCVLVRLLRWADINSRQIQTTIRELVAVTKTPIASVHRALARLEKRGHLSIERGARCEGILVTLTCDACFPKERAKPKSAVEQEWNKSGTSKVTTSTAPDMEKIDVASEGLNKSGTRVEQALYILKEERKNKEEKEIPPTPLVDNSPPDNLILLPTPEAPTEKSEPADRADNNRWPKAPALPMKPSQLSLSGGEALDLNFEAPPVHLLPADHLERYARLSQAVSPEFEDGVLAMRWAEHTAQNARRHQIVREYYALLIAEARLEMGWDHKTMALLFDFASTTQDEVLFGCTVTPYKLLSEWANGMTLLENLKAKFLASSKGKVLKKKANLKAALDALDIPQEIADDPYRI